MLKLSISFTRFEINYSSCTSRSSENICSSRGAQEKRKDRMKLSLSQKLMVFFWVKLNLSQKIDGFFLGETQFITKIDGFFFWVKLSLSQKLMGFFFG